MITGHAKYIVVSDTGGNEQLFPFHPSINHDRMFKAVRRMRFPNIISAGFINEDMICYGESITLRIKSRPEDTKLLKKMFSSEEDFDIDDYEDEIFKQNP